MLNKDEGDVTPEHVHFDPRSLFPVPLLAIEKCKRRESHARFLPADEIPPPQQVEERKKEFGKETREIGDSQIHRYLEGITAFD